MSKSKKILLPCSEAHHVCDKNQYKEATLWEKIRLTIHLAYCRACRGYTTKNSKLTAFMKKANAKTIDQTSKAELEQLIQRELSKAADK